MHRFARTFPKNIYEQEIFENGLDVHGFTSKSQIIKALDASSMISMLETINSIKELRPDVQFNDGIYEIVPYCIDCDLKLKSKSPSALNSHVQSLDHLKQTVKNEFGITEAEFHNDLFELLVAREYKCECMDVENYNIRKFFIKNLNIC